MHQDLELLDPAPCYGKVEISQPIWSAIAKEGADIKDNEGKTTENKIFLSKNTLLKKSEG